MYTTVVKTSLKSKNFVEVKTKEFALLRFVTV